MNADEPLICGGHDATTFFSECFRLRAGAWLQDASMNLPR
jgi:hypothetical protein